MNRRLPAADDNDDDDVEQHVLFDPSRYPDGTNGSKYMSRSSPPPRTRNQDRKHQKKKLGQHSRQKSPTG